MADKYSPGRPGYPGQHFAPWNDLVPRGPITTPTTSSPHANYTNSDSRPPTNSHTICHQESPRVTARYAAQTIERPEHARPNGSRISPGVRQQSSNSKDADTQMINGSARKEDQTLQQPGVKSPASQQPMAQNQQGKFAQGSGTSPQEWRVAIASSHQISANVGRPDKMDCSSDMNAGGTAATPQSDNGVNILDKYAFNLGRVAYNHRVPVHLTTGITLNVSRLNRYKTGRAHCQTTSPRLIPHDQELAVISYDTRKCIWVGMLPSQEQIAQGHAVTQPPNDINGEESPMKPAKKKSKPSASITDMHEDDIKVLPFSPTALRVVTKKSNKPVNIGCWYLYALVSPDEDNICEGFRVSYEDVFFFKEFRDDEAKKYSSRHAATKAKIKAHVFPPSAVDEADSPATAAASQPSEQAQDELLVHSKLTDNVVLDAMMVEIARSQARSEATRPNIVDPNEVTNLDKGLVSDAGSHKEAGCDGRATSPELSWDKLVAELEKDSLSDALDEDFEELEAFFSASADGGDKQAYPEHAVSANDASYKKYEDEVINKLLRGGKPSHSGSVQESATGVKGKGKGKCVAFETDDGQVVDNRGKVVSSDPVGSIYSDGYAGDGEKGGASTSTQTEAAGLANNLMEMVKELHAHGDIAALRQGYTLLKSLQNRSSPPKTAALGLYLNVPTDGPSDAKNYPVQLKELLELFPTLHRDDSINEHSLACMSHALRVTGQSIDIELLRPLLAAFSKKFRARFGKIPGKKKRVPDDMTMADVICESREEAEDILEAEIARASGHDERRDAGVKERNAWKPYVWE